MNRHHLPLTRHATTDTSAIGWGNDCIQFKPSHKPWVAGLNCRGRQYNKPSFTSLYFKIKTIVNNIRNCCIEILYFFMSGVETVCMGGFVPRSCDGYP